MGMTRRNFLKGTLFGLGAAGALSYLGCSGIGNDSAPVVEEVTYTPVIRNGVIPINGTNRTFQYLDAQRSDGEPTGDFFKQIVLGYHGRGGTGQGFMGDIGGLVPEYSNNFYLQNRLLLVTPDGTLDPESGIPAGRSHNCGYGFGAAWSQGVDDLYFAEELIRYLRQDTVHKHEFRKDDILVAGHSNGAGMVLDLMARLEAMYGKEYHVEGGLSLTGTLGGRPKPDAGYIDLTPQGNKSLLFQVSGGEDTVIPPNGSGIYRSLSFTVGEWVKNNGCSGNPNIIEKYAGETREYREERYLDPMGRTPVISGFCPHANHTFRDDPLNQSGGNQIVTFSDLFKDFMGYVNDPSFSGMDDTSTAGVYEHVPPGKGRRNFLSLFIPQTYKA